MGETLQDLRDRYESLLRNERLNLGEKVATAVDDFRHVSSKTTGAGSASGAAAATCPRVTFRLAELRSIDAQLSQRLRLDPLRHLRALEAACHLVAQEDRPGYDKDGTFQLASLLVSFLIAVLQFLCSPCPPPPCRHQNKGRAGRTGRGGGV